MDMRVQIEIGLKFSKFIVFWNMKYSTFMQFTTNILLSSDRSWRQAKIYVPLVGILDPPENPIPKTYLNHYAG